MNNLKYTILVDLIFVTFLIGTSVVYFGLITTVFATILLAGIILYPNYCRITDGSVKKMSN